MLSHSDDDNNIYKLETDSVGRVLTLSVRQPFASALCDGLKGIEIVRCRTDVRGNVLIVSTPLPDFPDRQGGCTVGIAELYDIKHVSELTDAEWEQTRVTDKGSVRGGYAWFFHAVGRVIEFPVLPSKHRVGYRYIDVDNIILYPKYVYYDK